MKRRIVVGGTIGGAVVALGFWWFSPGDPPEPVYRGRTLSSWLDDRQRTPQGLEVLTSEAVDAVRAIGPAAVPTLLAWLSVPDTATTRYAKLWLEWRLRLPVKVPTHQAKRGRAMYGFRALGPIARSAFPAIVALALHSPDEWQRGDAINALTGADADAMRLVALGLNSPDRVVRFQAIFIMRCLRIAPDEVCLPALEAIRNDPDPQIGTWSAVAISQINQQGQALARLLTSPNAQYRVVAAQSIGGFRTRAWEHLRALEVAAEDEDPAVRAAVAEAIRQVRGEK